MNVGLYSFEGVVTVKEILSQMEGGCIFTGIVQDEEYIRVKYTGRDAVPAEGDSYQVRGHKGQFRNKFGRLFVQIDTKLMRRVVTSGPLLKTLLQRMPNVGPTRADNLINAFGHQLKEVLMDASRFEEVANVVDPGHPNLAATITHQLYKSVAGLSGSDKMTGAEMGFMIFLEEIGINDNRIARKLWRFMAGLDAEDRLKRNPYLPACLMDWGPADKIGQKLLRAEDKKVDWRIHPSRLAGALNNVWLEVISEGDTAATEESVVAMLQDRSVNPEMTLRLAEENGSLRRLGPLLRAPGAAYLEDQVVNAILTMEKTPSAVQVPSSDKLKSLVFDAEMETGLTLTDEQRSAVMRILTLPVSALQGGAGVGKTTVMKVLANCWERLGGDVIMCALAGKASLTLSRGASTSTRPRLAYTIARLIGMAERQQLIEENPALKRPVHDVNFTPRTLLIVDEGGMLDTPSLHDLLNYLPASAKLLLAGDEGQLPPVGIGKVFHDVVAEGSRVARLTTVLRQAADSDIPKIAAMFRNGVAPELKPWTGQAKGVFLVPSNKIDDVQRSLRGKVELMVIAAMRKTVGSININQAFQSRDNKTPVRRLGPLATVAVGDPVVATGNRYQDGLFNGLLGVIDTIAEEEVTVHWDGENAARPLPKEAEHDIELAYAITCHRSQGSSSHSVITLVEPSRLVTREWLYTAITRSRELAILVGDSSELTNGLMHRTTRTTGLSLPARS